MEELAKEFVSNFSATVLKNGLKNKLSYCSNLLPKLNPTSLESYPLSAILSVFIAKKLVDSGWAYYDDTTSEELEELRQLQIREKRPPRYDNRGRYKEISHEYYEKNKDSKQIVVRFKVPDGGNKPFNDEIRGKVEFDLKEIDDFVILKSDGMPTYHLAHVVDDHEMKITHVIRGDDHMINSFKQRQIYEAMGWEVPNFAHIPLIHSEQGKKLSKRDNASTLEDYIKIGVISDALRNYLLRLGWSYKDKEIFTKQESIDLFDLSGVGKSPSKLDMNRIYSINETYIKTIDEKDLFNFFKEYVSKYKKPIDQAKESVLLKSMGFLKNKAKTLEDIWNNAQYLSLIHISEPTRPY